MFLQMPRVEVTYLIEDRDGHRASNSSISIAAKAENDNQINIYSTLKVILPQGHFSNKFWTFLRQMELGEGDFHFAATQAPKLRSILALISESKIIDSIHNFKNFRELIS